MSPEFTQEELKIIEEKAKEVGRLIRKQLPEWAGFTLILFTLGEKGWMTYLSTAVREDMIKGMKELIEKMEAEGDESQPC